MSDDDEAWHPYAKVYDPIKCGSLDRTDTTPHDRGIVRAMNSEYYPNKFVKGRPECTVFVSRLSLKTTKDSIKDTFGKFGKIKRFRLVRDIVTGMPKGYAFVEYESESSAENAYKRANKLILDGKAIFVDFECERLLKGWKPRRLGGGFGGKKESGQLRFGGRDRPFLKPIGIKKERHEYSRKRERSHERERDRHRRDNSHSKDRRSRSNDRRRSRSRERKYSSSRRERSREYR